MRHIFFLILIFLSITTLSDKFIEPKNAAQLNHDFDVLIFTQRWPITGCIEWMNEGGDHVCILPSQKDIWSIHGIWPTRFGTLGPFFCNKSATFDVAPLKPIIEQLERNWLNIEKGMEKNQQNVACNICFFNQQENQKHHYGAMNG